VKMQGEAMRVEHVSIRRFLALRGNGRSGYGSSDFI
jgi:hypothetical protein